MTNSSGKEYSLFKALSHPTRSKIIEALHENIELSYTELLNILGVDTGKLNFHLKNMSGLFETTEDGTYILTNEGRIAYNVIKETKKFNAEEIQEPQTSVIKRFIASAIDALIFLGTPIVVTILISIIFDIPFNYKNFNVLSFVSYMHAILSLTLVALVLMEMYNGQTIGKYIVRIRVLKVSGRKLNLIESAIRNIAKIFFLPLDVLVGMLFYKKFGFWRFADYYVKTKVVDV